MSKDQRLRPMMLVGTGSDVGKSVLATAFCRIFRQDGFSPAPFKAQNMALNSYVTPDGLEIGRAQAVQAEAAGIPCCADMNPLLLKPLSDHRCQVVLRGKPLGNRDAYDFWTRHRGGGTSPDFRREVCEAFDRLSARHHPVVMEGAGSISELNLRDTDLVNMPMARHADACVFLVADIDRGGVFASAYGSLALQEPDDRRRIKGIIVNKFRGDLRLFDEGRRLLERVCGTPVVGVVPHFSHIHIEAEDSVALAGKAAARRPDSINVAVVLLRHLSNFTDFDALERDSRVHLYYTSAPDDLLHSDIIILPGSKNTMDDLAGLRRSGAAQAIVQARRQGATVLGICGGYQMMGVEVRDPHHVEGDTELMPGLGLLPVSTVLTAEKLTRQVEVAPAWLPGTWLSGYEIHAGQTHVVEGATPSPLTTTAAGECDGYLADEKCMGTYVHGILDHREFVDQLLRPHAVKLAQTTAHDYDHAAFKARQYDLLADHVRSHVDMNLIYDLLKNHD